jgi:hypothetical protein
VAQQVVVQEVQVAAGQAIDFRQRLVNALRVEAASSLEERVLVAERAVMRAAA